MAKNEKAYSQENTKGMTALSLDYRSIQAGTLPENEEKVSNSLELIGLADRTIQL